MKVILADSVTAVVFNLPDMGIDSPLSVRNVAITSPGYAGVFDTVRGIPVVLVVRSVTSLAGFVLVKST